MKGSVIRSSGKASRTRTPLIAAAQKRTKELETAANLGDAYGILSMIIASAEKLEQIKIGIVMRSRLNTIANEAASIRDEVAAEFEKHKE